MHRTSIRNFEQANPLGQAQRPTELKLHPEVVSGGWLSRTRRAAGAVMHHSGGDLFERPSFAIGVHTQRNRSARAQCRAQEIERGRTVVLSTEYLRLIYHHGVTSDHDVRSEPI